MGGHETRSFEVAILVQTTLVEIKYSQEPAVALLPSTTHPQSWVEPHIHVHTGKSLPSVPQTTLIEWKINESVFQCLRVLVRKGEGETQGVWSHSNTNGCVIQASLNNDEQFFRTFCGFLESDSVSESVKLQSLLRMMFSSSKQYALLPHIDILCVQWNLLSPDGRRKCPD